MARWRPVGRRGYAIMRDAVRRCPALLLQPKIVGDLVLASLGDLGYAALRRIHWKRVLA